MDSTDPEPQDNINDAYRKSFGNTVLGNGARAHIGDAFHGVIYQGGKHVHRHGLPFLNREPIAKEAIEIIKSALYFREQDNRRIEVKEAYKKTFSWMFTEDTLDPYHFVNWLRCGNGCFWVSGKAGSGKSTLMKYIHQHVSLQVLLKIWAGKRDLIVATFFFWYAGQPLQKTQEGLLRSIIYQILLQRPKLTSGLFPDLFADLFRRLRNGWDLDPLHLSLADLRGACNRLSEIKSDDFVIFLLIDGMDEFEGDCLDLCTFILDLVKRPFIKMAVSSRPVPECHKVFSRCPATIRLQNLTMDDIGLYVEDNLLKDELFLDKDHLEEGFGQLVKTTLISKASGVFLWIVLVVRAILVGLANYEDSKTLLRMINELPSDLAELYEQMFGKMIPEHRREASTIFQIMRHITGSAKGPLRPLQLYIILKDDLELDESIYLRSDSWRYTADAESLCVKEVEGRLRSRCCGLLEVEQPVSRYRLHHSELKIAYLHRTVHDYLCDHVVWSKIIAACSLTPNKIDLALLLSNVHITKHGYDFLSEESSGYQRPLSQSFLKDLLTSSLYCSADLSANNEDTYPKYLVLIEQALLRSKWTTYESYLELYALYLHPGFRVHNHSDLGRIFNGNLRLQTMLVLVAAMIDLQEHCQMRMSEWDESLPVKSSILLYLLYLADTECFHSSPIPNGISIMLNSGVSSSIFCDLAVFHDLPRSIQDASLHATPALTPWRYLVYVIKVGRPNLKHWQIMLVLLDSETSLCNNLDLRADLGIVREEALRQLAAEKDYNKRATLKEVIARLKPVETGKAEIGKAETGKAETGKAETVKAETGKVTKPISSIRRIFRRGH